MSSQEPQSSNAADIPDSGSTQSNNSQSPAAAATPAKSSRLARVPIAEDRFGSAASDKFLESITIIAGFLVIAAFPVVTQNLNDSAVHPLRYFSGKAVQNFAAVAVGLFLVAIVFAQWTKLIWPDYEREDEGAVGKRLTRDQRALSVLALQCLLLTAIFFFLLVVAAFVGPVGLLFAVFDGLGLSAFLVTFVVVFFGAWSRNVKSVKEKRQRERDV